MVEQSAAMPRPEQKAIAIPDANVRVEHLINKRLVPKPPTTVPSIAMEKPKYEAAKVKKIEKKTPPLWETKAVFMPATAEFLKNCNIDPAYVNPKPMGEGLTHIVFDYRPFTGERKVVKIPRAVSKGLMSSGFEEERENVAIIQKYFGEYAATTEVRQDPKTKKYLTVQEAIVGETVKSSTETQMVRTQLADIMRLNREMMRQTGHSLDIIGLVGGMSWLRHSVRSIFTQKSDFDVSNILIQKDGKLKIIDFDVIRFKDIPPQQWAISQFGFAANRVIMRLYFGVDMKPKVESIPTNPA